MNTTKDSKPLADSVRISTNYSTTNYKENSSLVKKDIYVLCDGAIKRPSTADKSKLLTNKHSRISNRQCIKDISEIPNRKTAKKKKSKQLAQADHTTLDLITSKKSLIWLQKLDKNKLAVQWNIPNNIQRNCQDLLLSGEKAEFVLRLYQNVAIGNARWKTSQRTLEYAISIPRRKCYVNLENSGGGIFTAEIGVRSSNNRYIFIARSNKCATPGFMTEPDTTELTFNKSISRKLNIKTPKVFKSKSRLNHLKVSNFELRDRDILAEAQVSGIYTDFLREGPKVLKRKNEQIALNSVASRADYLNSLKISAKNKVAADTAIFKKKFNAKRLDQNNRIEKDYQDSPIKNYPEKTGRYIPENLSTDDIKANGVMIASMLNTQGTVAIDVFKKEEKRSSSNKNRKIVKVQSKKDLAKAIKKSGLHESSELILKGKLEPGRRVRVGGLLIDTESDGSFYVSCSIKNGKLHVPIEEIEAIVTE